MAHEAELDVDLDVLEQPETPNFPRRPNVVSRRGHRVKFNVCINEIREGTTHLTISAKVFTYGLARVGDTEHVSRSRRLWGSVPGKAFEIKPEDIPCKFGIVVSEQGDEHLGQGPYEAIITVNQSNEEPADPAAVTEGDEFSIEFLST